MWRVSRKPPRLPHARASRDSTPDSTSLKPSKPYNHSTAKGTRTMKKLTLSMDEKDIRLARRLAKEQGTSVSGMFTSILRLMAAKNGNGKKDELPPITRSLTGIIKIPEGKTDRELIEEAILEKHGFEP